MEESTNFHLGRNEFLTLSPKKTIFIIRTKADGIPSALCPAAVLSHSSKAGHLEGLISCLHFLQLSLSMLGHIQVLSALPGHLFSKKL